MDEELDRFKRVSLCEYAASRGYLLVRREPTRGGGTRGSTASSLLMRHPTTHDKIVVRLDDDGHWTYFSIRDDRDNGTIIDFVQRRGARTLPHVREELRAWSGQVRPVRMPDDVGNLHVERRRDRVAIREAFARAKVVSNHLYLNSRGIRPETLSCERFTGTWRVDLRGDLLFPHFDGPGPEGICGLERKNPRFTGFAAGGTKTLWTRNVRNDDERLVFTEAVLDAFSYHQLHPDSRTRYASTGGAFGERQGRHVARAIAGLPPGATVIAATDSDEAGEKLAAKVCTLAGEVTVVRHRAPTGKDWNEWLQLRERDYIMAVRLMGRGIGR